MVYQTETNAAASLVPTDVWTPEEHITVSVQVVIVTGPAITAQVRRAKRETSG